MRKPSIKRIRVGQTIWYPHRSYASPQHRYEARMVRVLSDKECLPPTYLVSDGFPRWYILQQIARGCAPEFISYSRRKVLSWIKLYGGRP